MTTSYSTLLKVILDHPYFGNDGCPVVDLIPTGATQGVMKSLMIRSVKRDAGIELFSGSSNGQAIGMETITAGEVVRLSLILRANDPTFLNYTNLPVSEASLNQIAYLTNLEGNDLSLDSDHRYPLLSPTTQFVFPSERGVTPESISLKDSYGNVIAPLPEGENDKLLVTSELEEEIGTNKKSTVVHLGLQHQSAGFYQLLINDAVEKPFVTAHDGLRPGDLGLLSIYLNKGAGAREDLTVRFTNRATKWRYFIIGEGISKQSIFITDQEGNKMPFELAERDAELPNGTTAKVAVSTAPIPLLRHYPTHHKLHFFKTIDGREKEFTIGLPNADSNRINYQTITDNAGNEKHQYFSDIFIYI